MIVLDTNVLSETLRPAPSARVLEWMRSEPASALFTTAITESELLYGIALLAEGRRRQALESVVDLIFAEDLAGRVLPFDSAAAREFAEIAASRRRAGGRFPKPTRALPPSPGPAAPRWRRETSGTLPVAGWN
jgi:hypothetical protein